MTSAFLFLPALENLTSGSNQKDLSNLLANNQVHNKMYISQKKKKKGLLTPCPRQAIAGITFSWAMHCKIRGAA